MNNCDYEALWNALYREKNDLSVGDRFVIAGDEYILAQTDMFHYCLICLRNGNRLKNPVFIKGTLHADVFHSLIHGPYGGSSLSWTDIYKTRIPRI